MLPDFEEPMFNTLSSRAAVFPQRPGVPQRLRGDFDRLPFELNLLIVRQLGTLDKISLVLACYRFSDDDIESMTHQRMDDQTPRH